MEVHSPSLQVLLEPALQPRPLAQKRFMCDLDRAVARRQQSRVREDREDLCDPLVVVRVELCERYTAADDRSCLAGAEAKHDRPCRVLLLRVEPRVRLLRESRNGAANATGAPIGLVAETATVSAAPQLEQRGGEERQAAGLAGDIADQGLHERTLDLELRTVRRELDCPGEVARLHWPNQHVIGAQ